MKVIIVAPSADAIRAQAALENQREIYKLARELDQNSLTRQARKSWERYQEANGLYSAEGDFLGFCDYDAT